MMRSFVARFAPLYLATLFVCLLASVAWAQDAAHPTGDLANAQPQLPKLSPHVTRDGASSTDTSVRVDSIPHFRGSFTIEGADPAGATRKTWNYTVAGNAPQQGGTTILDTSVIPVSLDLLDYDGAVRYHYDVTN